MKKRISCITIKSIQLDDGIASPVNECLSNSRDSSFILNNNDESIPGAVIYSRKVKITKIQTNNYLTEESLDYYA